MKQTIKAVYIIVLVALLAACVKATPVPTATSMPRPSPILVSATPTVSPIPSTPTFNSRTFVITPDDLFSLPGLKAFSTPNAEDFCEHLPSPQIVTNPDRLSVLSGRFALCIWERIDTAMDLDAGSLVSTDDERGDITMQNAPGGGDGNYGVNGWNNAYLNNAYVLEKYANHSGANHLSYEYCENTLLGQTDGGGMIVEEGQVACVRTTEGKIALLRVEKIYPSITLSVEFSFAILK